LKVLLVNLLAVLNFANVFLNKKRLENKKNVKNVFTAGLQQDFVARVNY